MLTAQIDLRVLHAVSLAASNDETRYYLQGVYVECQPTFVRYTATDGCRLISVRCDSAKDQEPNTLTGNWIVPTDVCRAYKPGKVRSASEVLSVFDQAVLQADASSSVKLTIEHRGAGRSFTTIDGTFPDFARVIPREFSGESDGVWLNPDYLVSFVKFGAMLGIGRPQIAWNGNAAMGVVFLAPEAANVLAVLMPMRADTQADLAARIVERRDAVLAS